MNLYLFEIIKYVRDLIYQQFIEPKFQKHQVYILVLLHEIFQCYLNYHFFFKDNANFKTDTLIFKLFISILNYIFF